MCALESRGREKLPLQRACYLLHNEQRRRQRRTSQRERAENFNGCTNIRTRQRLPRIKNTLACVYRKRTNLCKSLHGPPAALRAESHRFSRLLDE